MRIYLGILTSILTLSVMAQGVVNKGANIVLTNSANVVITTSDGNYTSKGDGMIYSKNGSTIILRGDWINSGNTAAIGSNNGLVILDGDTQFIDGPAQTNFDSLWLRGTGEKFLQTSMLVGGGQSGAHPGIFDLGTRPFHMEGQTVIVNNQNPAAIQSNGGQLLGETNSVVGYSTVQWNIRNSGIGNTYSIPFGSKDRIDIPVSINMVLSGSQFTDSGFVAVSTYPTSSTAIPNNRPLPTGVANLYNDYKFENDIKSLDRYYIFNSGGYSSTPTTTIELPYIDREWDMSGGSTNDIVEADLKPAVYRFGSGQWDYTFDGTTNTSGNVSVSQELSDLTGVWILQNVPPCPVAHFNANDDCINLGITARDSSYVSSGLIDTSVWQAETQVFGDKSLLHYYFNNAGTFPIKRKVRSDRGCWDSVEYQVEVYPLPTASFDYRDTCFGELTTFSALSSTPTGAPVTNRWLIDGNPQSSQTVYHTYSDTGLKAVRLTAENTWGCMDSLERLIEIEPLPNVSFTYSDICEGALAEFINTTETKGSMLSQHWSVDEVLSSFSHDYSQVFNRQGAYDIKLVGENSFGCRDSVSQGLVVQARAVANFSVFPEEIFITEPHVNLVETTEYANTWEWELGDMSATEYGPEVFHTYNDTGLFSIRLIANNDQNCADTLYKVIRIKPYLKIYIPNAFRPDGDPNNVNATFKPAGMLYGLKEMTMEIYNRWGERLYFTDDINRPWDGTYKGKPVNEGTYLYLIKIKDIYNQVAWHQGTVTLIR